ncbi:hypothetical protein RN001_013293 [Aquatica leii]|uniref:Retrotransposon gag domain-containing protein n=1 Tax=Aquatica leii TaxID=1421715 RepID=A0AAN7QD11_9COLE|nr:hypothetical protein RN001_013293 [Aquatica leii]
MSQPVSIAYLPYVKDSKDRIVKIFEEFSPKVTSFTILIFPIVHDNEWLIIFVYSLSIWAKLTTLLPLIVLNNVGTCSVVSNNPKVHETNKINRVFHERNRTNLNNGYKLASLRDESLVLAVEEGVDTSSESDEQESSEVFQSTRLPTPPQSRVKSVPVCKWGVKFSGDDDTSLSAFLEQVENLRVARKVSFEELFNSGIDLFCGKALLWYRANRRRASDWPSLVKLLRDQFQPVDYDERLLDEIKRRTQGETESMGIYLSVMETMFSRMSFRMPESQQLRILLRNITPFYQDHLTMVDVTSKEELLQYGRKLETRRSHMQNFAPPPSRRNRNLLEPDLAFVEAAPSSSGVDVANITCFNCRKQRHKRAACKEPRKLRCFRCGALDVTVRTCTNCRSGNGGANR